jgi:hypothetical protein
MAWLVIKDETDYNGERSYIGVFHDEDVAKAVADCEHEKSKDWMRSMTAPGEQAFCWVPNFSVEYVRLDSE